MMPVIATVLICLFFALGAFVQVRERGYAFDLRKGKGGEHRGRRTSDRS